MSNNPFLGAVFFTDIVGSSQLYASLGNEKAKYFIDNLLVLCSSSIVENNGRVVKTIGDEIMASFVSLEKALDSAVEINQIAKKHNAKMRTGVCFGEMILDMNDIFGDVVNNAAYLTKCALPSQILTDELSYSRFPSHYKNTCELFDRVVIKGKHNEVNLYRINWENSDTVSMDATQISPFVYEKNDHTLCSLELRFAGKTILVEAADTKLSFGRDANQSDYVILNRNVSRKHCSVYFERGKFILADHSTNGTYLYPDSGGDAFLRRESTVLVKSGFISLGSSLETPENGIHYRVFRT